MRTFVDLDLTNEEALIIQAALTFFGTSNGTASAKQRCRLVAEKIANAKRFCFETVVRADGTYGPQRKELP